VTSEPARTGLGQLGEPRYAQRIRHDPRVLVAPSTARGAPRGPSITASARVVDDAREAERAEAALTRKYGFARRVYRRLAGEGDAVYLALEG
jgi:hypothetical protein